tara:strand:- start:8864 stop:9148 length:285 start_codon:yes stop_codon:yes gene_type:complete
MSEQKEITVTVVEVADEQYYLETLLHTAIDRTHMCGLMIEEFLLLHPYLRTPGGGRIAKAQVKQALETVWGLYGYLKEEKEKLLETKLGADKDG